MDEHTWRRNSNYTVVLPLERFTLGLGCVWKQGHLVLANMSINMHLCNFTRYSKFLEFQVFTPSEQHCSVKFNLMDFIFKEANNSRVKKKIILRDINPASLQLEENILFVSNHDTNGMLDFRLENVLDGFHGTMTQ